MKCAGIGGLTTEVTVSLVSYYIIFARNLSMLRQPPRRVSYTLAGWLFMLFSVRISLQKCELSTFPTSYPQVTGSQLLRSGLGGGLAAVGV